MSLYPILLRPHWCIACHQRPVDHRNDACPGCMGDLDQQVDPITRHAPTMPRPSRWARVWAWLNPKESK